MVKNIKQNLKYNVLDNKRRDPADVTLVGHHKKGVIFDIKERNERKVDRLDTFIII